MLPSAGPGRENSAANAAVVVIALEVDTAHIKARGARKHYPRRRSDDQRRRSDDYRRRSDESVR